MAQSLAPVDIAALAQSVAEQISALCPHVPPNEVADISSRLAFTELAHASDTSFDHADTPTSAATAGNRVVWLPGASASAIVLPAGEEQSRGIAAAAQLRAWARRYGGPVPGILARGSGALRQIGAALVSAYQARPRVQ